LLIIPLKISFYFAKHLIFINFPFELNRKSG
jgi:hypothetical protein